MRECVRLTALSPEEKQFAEENFSAVQWCIRAQRLDEDLHDIAYIGYLHAVKKWFTKPELRKWTFRTILNQTVRSHISSERQKQKRRIDTMSLDAVIPGTDGFTYGSVVTYEDMGYLRKEETDMALKMNYDIAIPAAAKLGRTPSVEIEKLAEFLDSRYKTMSFEYFDAKEAASKCGTLRNWKKKSQRTDFEIYRMAGTIYIEKVKLAERRK